MNLEQKNIVARFADQVVHSKSKSIWTSFFPRFNEKETKEALTSLQYAILNNSFEEKL